MPRADLGARHPFVSAPVHRRRALGGAAIAVIAVAALIAVIIAE